MRDSRKSAQRPVRIAVGALRRLMEDLLQAAGYKGHFMIAIDPASFGASHFPPIRCSPSTREVKVVRRALSVATIRLPGEQGFAARLDQRRTGVRILPKVWVRTRALAESLGVALPR
jgi:LDH2 family malate/lactate/ureidoglycolate dehydrogenase